MEVCHHTCQWPAGATVLRATLRVRGFGPAGSVVSATITRVGETVDTAAPKGQLLPGTSQAEGPRGKAPGGTRSDSGEGVSICRPLSPFGARMDFPFSRRHIGPSAEEQRRMLDAIG